MHTKQILIHSLQMTAQNLCEDDLHELQRFADYLIHTEPKDGARLSVHQISVQQTSVLITYVLQRSHLISMVNHLANIILRAEGLSASDKLEAQEAIKKASWIR